MGPARKRRIHQLRDGKCSGWGKPCGLIVPVQGPGVVYDHRHQLAMDGPEEDSNVFLMCPECVARKNAHDAQARGKVRRIRKKAVRIAQDGHGDVAAPTGRPKRKIASRGFPTRPAGAPKAKFPSRPFPKPRV